MTTVYVGSLLLADCYDQMEVRLKEFTLVHAYFIEVFNENYWGISIDEENSGRIHLSYLRVISTKAE